MSTTSPISYELLDNVVKKYGGVMILHMYVEDVNLKAKYIDHVNAHNNRILYNSYADAGFDLLIPKAFTYKSFKNFYRYKIDHKIKCNAFIYKSPHDPLYKTAYTLNCRSSIYKTLLRLTNNQGIIDAGYRGNICAMCDVAPDMSKEEYYTLYVEDITKEEDAVTTETKTTTIAQYDRLFQLCSPSLYPIYVNIVDNISELDLNTERGEGGFGSTTVAASAI